MYLVGSDDGVYRVSTDGATQVLESGRVKRLAQFDGAGVFAATETGLYRRDGDEWVGLDVPEERVYAVEVGPDGKLYAGTRPSGVYVADSPERPEWRDLPGFREIPSREDWRLPRHENLAQVRDVHAFADDRLVVGVEVGGVHVSDDAGETWAERHDGVHDDTHELHAVTESEYVSATGFGLFRTDDAGRSWDRLDDGYDQRYFRCAHAVDGVVYASAALANSSTWEDEDADPALFAYQNGELRAVDTPFPTAVATGLTHDDGDLVAATHRGQLFVKRDDWERLGSFPVSEQFTGRYTPVAVV